VFSDSGMAHFDRTVLNLKEDHESDVFTIKTLDGVPEISELPRLDFMKIDIEGFEYKALRGGEKLIRAHKPNMLIEIHTPENYKGVYGFLSGLGYKFFDLDMNKVDLNTQFAHQIHHIYVSVK